MEKKHEGMIDNRHVNENHQKGIERVKQHKGSMEKGQGGKMGMGEKAEWKRGGESLTPRRG